MNFENYICVDFISLAKRLNSSGFKVGVIGGSVRDFLLNLPCKHDYDCELRLVDNQLDIEEVFAKLALESYYLVSKLPYNILKIEHENFTAELSLPRIENFFDTFEHSNFEAHFIADEDYSLGFLRRDFTINAIMFELNGTWKFIDPLCGEKDLTHKKLRPCSETFFKDPVRYLRGVRFRNSLGFELEKSIVDAFLGMKLGHFSSHYLRMEAMKSKAPVTYIFDLLELLERPLESKYRQYIKKIENDVNDLKKHLSSLVFLETGVRRVLSEIFDFSIRNDDKCFPLNLKMMSALSYDELFEFIFENNVMATIKDISRLDQRYYDYLFDCDLVDLCYLEFKIFSSHKVELEEIERSKRKSYNIYKKLNAFFE